MAPRRPRVTRVGRALARSLRRAAKKQYRKRKGIPSAMAKVYSYTFQPDDQWIASTANSTAGDVAIVPLEPPLKTAGITSPVPAQSGFTFYYDMGVSMVFKVQDIGNFVNFARIYNEYKINSIQVKLTYLTADAAINGNALLPTLNYVMDTSDPFPPTALSDVQGKAGARTLHVSSQRNILTLNIKPHIRTVVATASPNSDASALVQRAGWISVNNQDVVHYAGKFWFQNMYLPVSSGVNTAIQWEYKFNVSFRGAKNLF